MKRAGGLEGYAHQYNFQYIKKSCKKIFISCSPYTWGATKVTISFSEKLFRLRKLLNCKNRDVSSMATGVVEMEILKSHLEEISIRSYLNIHNSALGR